MESWLKGCALWVIRELRVLLYVLATLVKQILSQIPPVRVLFCAVMKRRVPYMAAAVDKYLDSNWQVSGDSVPRYYQAISNQLC